MMPSLFLMEEPSGYPSVIQITIQTSETVTFEWKALECYQENGPITGYNYRIYYNLNNYNAATVSSSITMITLFHQNIQGFSVAAMNEAGIGEHCPPLPVLNLDQGMETILTSVPFAVKSQVLH